jgi:hypothetical protein
MPASSRALLVVVLVLAAGACGGDDGGATPTPDITDITDTTAATVEPTDQPDQADEDETDDSGTGSPDTDSENSETDDAPITGGDGTVTTDAGTYVFQPQACVITPDEIEIHGPGAAPDGTPVYIDLGVGDGYATLSIDIGTDSQFVSGDGLLTTISLTDDLDVTVSGSTVTGTAALTEVRDGGGGEVSAAIAVDCR